MTSTNWLVYFFLVFFPSDSTIDINMVEYQYLADHLTREECRRLVAALHFSGFDLPPEINSAERRLPEDVSCIDLLLHWNATPREGKGETHVKVCHRLNQIGREDLAEWLSKSVFHEISKDLKGALNTSETEATTPGPSNVTEFDLEEKVPNEGDWWKLDSFLVLITFVGLVALIMGFVVFCYLCCTRKSKSSRQGYKKLPTTEED